jgi:pimeloyl-ACP methyl ester carboxylesterase
MTVETATTAPAGFGTMRLRRASVAVLSCLAFAVLCTGSAGAAPPSIDWSDCGESLQCAQVRVPLDWSKPSGRQITLAVSRHLASDPSERIGSLFINPGGPGNSGINNVVKGGAGLDPVFRGRFDIVGWDLRGSGQSTAVSCFASQDARDAFWSGVEIPITPAESRQYLPKTVAFARRCGRLNRHLLPHLSETDTARDLDYLRHLVGDRQLTYYGASAGTLIGETYIALFPERVRAIILDGVVDPVAWTANIEDLIANTRSDADLVVQTFESTCESAGPILCALAGKGPVAARVQGLLDQLRRGPVPAPSAPTPGGLTYGQTVSTIGFSMDHPADWPGLATALDEAADGDGSALATMAEAGLSDVRTTQGEGTESILCADSPASQPPRAWPSVAARLTRVSQFVGPAYTWSFWAPCASWTTRSVGRYTGPWNTKTKNPILVQDNEVDPSTPFANARREARRLGNAVLLPEHGYGHLTTADLSRCVLDADGAYMVDLVTPPPGTVCQPDRPPFDPDFGKPLP